MLTNWKGWDIKKCIGGSWMAERPTHAIFCGSIGQLIRAILDYERWTA